MDFTEILTSNFVLVVFVACLCVGYLIKTSVPSIDNKYIPLILACIGGILNPIVVGFTIDSVVYGVFMGLSSTGFHQLFKQFVENKKEK